MIGGEMRKSLILVFLVCYYAETSRAQMLPISRTVDWTQVGIQGGVPSGNWPIYTTLSASGGADDSVAIQKALDAAHTAYPHGAVVLLNPGNYTLHRASIVAYNRTDDYAAGIYECGLVIDHSNVVLRGSGPNKTTFNYGDGANIISLGTTYLSASNVVFINVTSTANKGANSITLANTTGISVGTILVVTQKNPTDTDGNPLVDTKGYGGSSASGHNLLNNAMTQINRVTSISGSTVTLEVPLYFNYDTVPQVYVLPNIVQNSGIENLRIVGTHTSGPQQYKNINLESCASCWVINCESDDCVDRAHIYLSDCYRCQIQNNYLNGALNASGTGINTSGEDYALFLEFRNSACLMENNIIHLARHSQVMNGGSGNVWGYNYDVNPYMGEYHNTLPDRGSHAAHPYMNLWEGNDMPNIEMDFTHGSNSHNTFFRNYINLISNNPDTGSPMTGAIYAINMAYQSNYENIIANVLGPYGSRNTATSYQNNADAGHTSSIYTLGYWDDGGTASPNLTSSAKVENTMLRGGNWDSNTNTVVWNNNVPSGSLASTYLAFQQVPVSLYKSSKPTWFTATGAAWPPVDPAAPTKQNKIPARLCYEAQNLGNGGTFDPTFYGISNPTSVPLTPTDLRITTTQ